MLPKGAAPASGGEGRKAVGRREEKGVGGGDQELATIEDGDEEEGAAAG